MITNPNERQSISQLIMSMITVLGIEKEVFRMLARKHGIEKLLQNQIEPAV